MSGRRVQLSLSDLICETHAKVSCVLTTHYKIFGRVIFCVRLSHILVIVLSRIELHCSIETLYRDVCVYSIFLRLSVKRFEALWTSTRLRCVGDNTVTISYLRYQGVELLFARFARNILTWRELAIKSKRN